MVQQCPPRGAEAILNLLVLIVDTNSVFYKYSMRSGKADGLEERCNTDEKPLLSHSSAIAMRIWEAVTIRKLAELKEIENLKRLLKRLQAQIGT